MAATTVENLEFHIKKTGMSDEGAKILKSYADALKEMKESGKGNPISQNLVKNISALAGAMKAIDTAAISKMRQLADALKTFDGLKSISLNAKFATALTDIAAAADLLTDNHIDKLTRFGNALKNMQGVKTNIGDKLPAQITNLAAAVDNITDETVNRLNRLTKAISRLRGIDLRGLSSLMTGQRREATQSANQKPDSDTPTGSKTPTGGQEGSPDEQGEIKHIKDMFNVLKNKSGQFLGWHFRRLISDFKKLGQQALEAAKAIGGKLVSSIKVAASAAVRFGKNLIAMPIQAISSRVKKLKSQLSGLISSFKRILFYRTIRTVIKELGEALDEGTENAYWFSKKFGNATNYIANAYDSFASATFKMKNQIGAAWATLFANVEPIINKIVVLVTKAAEVVTMFFAKLGGSNTYLKAIDYTKNWADETDKGAKAAKEWRNQLLGFDVINRLDALSDNSSSKADDLYKDYENMFEEVEVDSAIANLADRMRELWESQDWEGLGKLIGDTLNGLFPSREKWQEWGSYFGNGIDGLIQTAYYALKTIDFSEWGSRIANGLNSAIDEIDFYVAGELFTRKITAMIDLINGFLSGLDFHDIGQAIGDFFRGALDEGTSWLNDHDFGEIAQKFWGSIKEAITGFDIDSFSQSLGNFTITAMKSVADFVSNTPWDDVVNTVLSSIESFTRNVAQDGRMFAAFNDLKESLISAFELAISTFGNWVGTKDWNAIGGSFMSALARLLEDLGRIASAVPWTTLANALIGFVSGALDSFTTWLEGKDFTDLGEKFNAKITTALENIKVEELVTSLSNAITTAVTKLGEFIFGADVGDLAAKIGAFLGRAIESVDTVKLLSSLTYMLTAALLDVPSIILGILEGEFHTLAGFTKSLGWDRVSEFVEGMAGNTAKLRTLYRNGFVEPTAQTLKELFQGHLPAVGSTGAETIANEMESTVSGSHLSGKFQAMGESITDSVGAGVDKKLPDIHSRVRDAVSETSATVELKLGKIAETSEREWQRYSYAADSNLQLVTSAADSNTSQLAQTVESNLSGIQQSADTSFSGVKATITSATGDITRDSTSDTQTLYNDVTGIYNNIHREAVRVFSDIARNVPIIMNGMASEIQSCVQRMEQSFTTMQYTVSGVFDTIRANIESAIYAIQGIDWSIPAPHLPHITWYYDTVYSDDGSSFNIPQFDVQWYAKGGVLDNPTLFGMGDAGAEALVPLERNTEWIGRVAAEMNKQSESQKGRDDSNDEIIEALYTVCDRIIRAMPDDGDDLDMDSFAKAVTKLQRRQARAMG